MKNRQALQEEIEGQSEAQVLEHERWQLLRQVEAWLEMPMLALAFFWLALFVVEIIWGLSPLLESLGTIIWIIFIVNFCLEFALAPRKLSYLRTNWLTAISLAVPALRLLRFARLLRVMQAARATRGLRLLRVISSLNRGMRALAASMSRRGFGYVIALTLIVTLAGAAGMHAFEREAAEGAGLTTYGAALWWTAMLMTTMGSEYWPRTPEGRVLCLLLATYAFAVFGYVTATLASFFIGRDAENAEAEIAGAQSIAALQAEIAALRAEIASLARQRGAT